MGHQTLSDNQLGAFFKIGDGGAGGVIHAFDLHHLHLDGAVLFHIYFSDGVEDTLARALAGTVVLLYIFYLGVLADIKAMDTVVLRIMRAAVVDTAACDDHDVGVVADEEVVVDLLFDTALGDHHGDMHLLVLGAGLDENINTADSLFGDDLDILAGLPEHRLGVGTDIKRAGRDILHISDFVEQELLCL